MTSTGAANSVRYIKQQILCFICPLLLMAPCMFYKMFEYSPTAYSVMCTFKTPTGNFMDEWIFSQNLHIPNVRFKTSELFLAVRFTILMPFSGAESNQIGLTSTVMLFLTLWLPAHTLLVLSYKRNKVFEWKCFIIFCGS